VRYTYDTEFIDNGSTIELLSIGIVAEDGREYYAVISDPKVIERAWNAMSGGEYWLRKNVLNSFPIKQGPITSTKNSWAPDDSHPDWDKRRTREEMAREVHDFLRYDSSTPEYWAWYAAYDHVALSQLFGRMIDLPLGLPMYTNDIKQEHRRLGYPRIPEQLEGAHNALSDARWNMDTLHYLEALDGPVQSLLTANPKRTRTW
jgi:hypothetical protein